MIVKYLVLLVLAFAVIPITFALEDKSTLDGMSPQSIIYPQGCVTPNGIPPLDYGKSFRIPLIGDIFGSPFDHIDKGQEVDIRASIEGDYYSEIPFVYIVQIQNNLGSVVLLEWIQSTMPLEKRTIEVSISWKPVEVGEYVIEHFIWNSIDDAIPLCTSQYRMITVI